MYHANNFVFLVTTILLIGFFWKIVFASFSNSFSSIVNGFTRVNTSLTFWFTESAPLFAISLLKSPSVKNTYCFFFFINYCNRTKFSYSHLKYAFRHSVFNSRRWIIIPKNILNFKKSSILCVQQIVEYQDRLNYFYSFVL